MNTIDSHSQSPLTATWVNRFEFFEVHGEPGSKPFRKALTTLPRRKRLRIGVNFFAIFFGFFYFALGLWKKALSLIGIALLIFVGASIFEVVTEIEVPGFVVTALDSGLAVVCGMSCNYAYYLKRIKSQQGWNPF